jgi:hypothetical protein
VFIGRITEILGKAFNGFGQWHITAVIATNDALALQVGYKDCRRHHIIIIIYPLLQSFSFLLLSGPPLRTQHKEQQSRQQQEGKMLVVAPSAAETSNRASFRF